MQLNRRIVLRLAAGMRRPRERTRTCMHEPREVQIENVQKSCPSSGSGFSDPKSVLWQGLHRLWQPPRSPLTDIASFSLQMTLASHAGEHKHISKAWLSHIYIYHVQSTEGMRFALHRHWSEHRRDFATAYRHSQQPTDTARCILRSLGALKSVCV